MKSLSLLLVAAVAVVPTGAITSGTCAVCILPVPSFYSGILTMVQQMCINNMNAKASELGCSAGDSACLCTKVNYQYGIRDCTNEACPGEDASAAVSSALASCPTTFGTFLSSYIYTCFGAFVWELGNADCLCLL